MNPHFSILPWEHRGSIHDVTGTPASLEVAGQTRSFALRMREGVIYFVEPKRAPMWAVTRQFERHLSGDELIEAWREEMACENFGRFVVYRPNFPGTSVNTTLAIVHRGDYGGWVREWFAPNWLQTPVHRDGKRLDVWGDKFQKATRRAFGHANDALLNRAMEPGERRDWPQRWMRGDAAELERLFGLAARLFVRRDLNFGASSGPFVRKFVASSPAHQGGWVGASWLLPYTPDLQFSPAFSPLLQLLQEHFLLVGLSWKKTRYVPKTNPFGPRWRGHWQAHAPEITMSHDADRSLSSHDKLEAILELRDWLQDKVSPRKCRNLLSKVCE